MPYLQCPKCGLSNWSTHRQCVRCITSLETVEGFHAPQPAVRRNPRKRILLIGIVLLGLLVIVGGTVAYTSIGRREKPNPNAPLEAALRASAEFNVPVVVEAGRYKYYDQDERRLDQEATPEAYVLNSLGLLYVHNGMYSDAPMTRAKDGGLLIDPMTGIVPQQYKHVELEITQSGQAQSATWEPYEVKRDGKLGWKVPIGERQFGRVIQVMAMPENHPTGDEFWVSFTWKWKPNETGQAFDKRDPSYRAPDKPKNFPRSSFDVVVNDSQAVYWGTATLIRTGTGWEAQRIMWSGPGGVVLSPNMSEQIDKMVRDSR
ncbi:MAG: hypothetical protein JWM21_2679 [Acidobacteria bacterium]|nr:hypothetical protein [Acidobacteriota bacterium]